MESKTDRAFARYHAILTAACEQYVQMAESIRHGECLAKTINSMTDYPDIERVLRFIKRSRTSIDARNTYYKLTMDAWPGISQRRVSTILKRLTEYGVLHKVSPARGNVPARYVYAL